MRVAEGTRLLLQFSTLDVRDSCRSEGNLETFATVDAQVVSSECGACDNCGPGQTTAGDQVSINYQPQLPRTLRTRADLARQPLHRRRQRPRGPRDELSGLAGNGANVIHEEERPWLEGGLARACLNRSRAAQGPAAKRCSARAMTNRP